MSKLRREISPNSRTVYRQLERKLNGALVPRSEELNVLIGEIKYSLRPDQFRPLVSELRPTVRDLVMGNPLPKQSNTVGKIGKHRFRSSFFNEFQWLLFCLEFHHNEINLFVALEIEFEKHFLLGQYEQAEDVIDAIEIEICVSKWSIEKRLLLAEYTTPDGNGKSAVFDFLTKDTERLLKINLSYISTRIDKQLPIYRYEQTLQKFVERQKGGRLVDYFLYELNYFERLAPDEIELVLYLNSNFSIIDRYLAFVKICTSIISHNKYDNLYAEIVSDGILTINKYVHDSRIRNLALLKVHNLHTETDDKLTAEYLLVLNEFYNCRFKKCLENGVRTLQQNPTVLEIVPVVMKAAIILGLSCPIITPKNSFINRICADIYNVLQKNDDYDSALYDLTKIAKSVATPSWCAFIMSLVRDENSTVDVNYNFQIHRFVNSSIIDPELVSIGSEFPVVRETVKKIFEKSNIAELDQRWFSIHNEPLSLENASSIFITVQWVKRQIKHEKWYDALQLLGEINRDEKYEDLARVSFLKLELIQLELHCLEQLGHKLKALQLLCKSVIVSPKYFTPLYRESLIEFAANSSDELIQADIATPILIRMYATRTNQVWVAYDNFMCSNGFVFPRDLFGQTRFDRNLLKYFLRYVCEKDVFDSSPDFNSPEELDDERIAICNYLKGIDDASEREYYLEEITEIEKNILIKKGEKEVNQSKIYVDETGIRFQISSEIKDRFARGMELKNLSQENIEQLLDVSMNVLLLLFDSNDNGTLKYQAFKQKYNIANHPHFENFAETFKLVRDRFISSNEFGLDSYISMRIRHGTLLGQIRSIFEKHKLITKRSASSKQYVPNEYWLAKLCLEDKCRTDIVGRFNELSEFIDAMSEEIKNTFLQVHTEEKKNGGMFDYSYSEEELVELYKTKFLILKTHEDFLNTAFGCLWERTELNLGRIRDLFNNDIQVRAIKALEQLSTSIARIMRKYDGHVELKEFARVITTSQTDVALEFSKIALWFRRSFSNTINEFDMRMLINTSLSVVNKMHQATPIKNPIVKGELGLKFHGQYFTMLIDIMRNLLDNAVTHSHLCEPDLEVHIDVNLIRNKLSIEVRNNVAQDVNVDSLNASIATAQRRLERAIDEELVRKEGGSGYPKVKKIIKFNMMRKNYEIKLGQIGSDRIFVANITFEADGMLKS